MTFRTIMRSSTYLTFGMVCAGVVAFIAFLELNTDVISDIRVYVGVQEGEVSQNSLVFDDTGTLAERATNWRAYSGLNRHLPSPEEGWARQEIDVGQIGAIVGISPESAGSGKPVEAARSKNLAKNSEEPQLPAKAVGAANYASDQFQFLAILVDARDLDPQTDKEGGPHALAAWLEEQGGPEVVMGGRVFEIGRAANGTLMALNGQIGKNYRLVVLGDAPLNEIEAHIERMDFYRLEAEGAEPVPDIDAIGQISGVLN